MLASKIQELAEQCHVAQENEIPIRQQAGDGRIISQPMYCTFMFLHPILVR